MFLLCSRRRRTGTQEVAKLLSIDVETVRVTAKTTCQDDVLVQVEHAYDNGRLVYLHMRAPVKVPTEVVSSE